MFRKLKTVLDPDDLSRILGHVGNHFPDLYEMFKKLMDPCGLLFYDMTSIISYSKNLKLVEKGYRPSGSRIQQPAGHDPICYESSR